MPSPRQTTGASPTVEATVAASASPTLGSTSVPVSPSPPLPTVAGCTSGVNCALVKQAIDQIDPARMDEHMRALAAVGSRDPRHPGHAQAVTYIKDQLQKLATGGWTIESQRTVHQGIPLENIFASIGTDHGGWVLVSAHYDSIANRTPGWRPAVDPAPGADDNATGTAALLEFARVISQLEKLALYNRVVLAFFDGEELFFKGSAAYMQTLEEPYRYTATVNIDMVGFNPLADRLDLIWYGPQSDQIRDRVKGANERYGIGVQLVDVFANDGNRYILDSAPFGLAGIPSVTLAERYGPADATYPGNTFFHTVNDTPDKVTNPRLWLKAARLTLAVALEHVLIGN